MQLKKSEKRMLIFLGIIVVVGLGMQFIGKKEPAKHSSLSKGISSINKSNNEESTPSIEKNYQKVVYEGWGRNPFSRKNKQEENTYVEIQASLNLKGIIWKQGKPYALINDYILAEGESEGGIRIVSITNNTVVCQSHGNTFTLEWKG